MEINYYEHQVNIAQNLIAFIRQEGYTKLSLSKLSGVPRPAIDQMLLRGGENISEKLYNTYILKISQTFNLQEDFFLRISENPKPNYPLSPAHNERSEVAKELLIGLENMIGIYSLYVE